GRRRLGASDFRSAKSQADAPNLRHTGDRRRSPGTGPRPHRMTLVTFSAWASSVILTKQVAIKQRGSMRTIPTLRAASVLAAFLWLSGCSPPAASAAATPDPGGRTLGSIAFE